MKNEYYSILVCTSFLILLQLVSTDNLRIKSPIRIKPQQDTSNNQDNKKNIEELHDFVITRIELPNSGEINYLEEDYYNPFQNQYYQDEYSSLNEQMNRNININTNTNTNNQKEVMHYSNTNNIISKSSNNDSVIKSIEKARSFKRVRNKKSRNVGVNSNQHINFHDNAIEDYDSSRNINSNSISESIKLSGFLI